MARTHAAPPQIHCQRRTQTTVEGYLCRRHRRRRRRNIRRLPAATTDQT